MEVQEQPTNVADQEIWRCTLATEYAVPSDLPTDTLRGFRRLWKIALNALPWRQRATGETPERDRLPSELLDGLVPGFDAGAIADALAETLDGSPDAEPAGRRTRLLVGPPGTHPGEIVTALARRAGWPEIAPPARADLIRRPQAIGERLESLAKEVSQPAAIPELHRWLLRSEHGLPQARELLERLRQAPAPLLIGCDSWAWSFLDRTVGIGDLLGQPLALAALDGAGLASWLGSPFRAGRLVCRSAERRQETIFGAPASAEQTNGDDAVPNSLVRLAALARGNPGVALELWRRCLRVESGDGNQPQAASTDLRDTIWATSLHESEVVVPRTIERIHNIILHTVLLHGGLEPDLLAAVLPFARHELRQRVGELVRQGLLEERKGEVAMVVAAYPAVRDHLDTEGFLIDGF